MSFGSDFVSAAGPGRSPKLLSEINVTPFVDVMLVLLVIFMVTAPILVTGVDVDLPDDRTKQLASDVEPIEVSIDANQNIYLGDSLLSADEFEETLAQLALSSSEEGNERVYVRADKTISYGTVMAIVAQISEAGFTKVAFISDSSDAVDANNAQ